MKKKYRYVITTGWWCDYNENIDTRDKTYGSDNIREQSFFNHWFSAIDQFTTPQKILVVDSNSPISPPLPNDQRIEWVKLDSNTGHSTNHTTNWSGVTRAHIAGMTYALACDTEYWVYVEQDALIYGKGIIEHCIEHMKKPIMFGTGTDTPQPMQQSLMILHRSAIPSFLQRLTSISAKDKDITPEMKFAMSSTRYAKFFPEWAFCQTVQGNFLKKEFSRVIKRLLSKNKGYDELPIGYGRVRPIDFSKPFFYFQHGAEDELHQYYSKVN